MRKILPAIIIGVLIFAVVRFKLYEGFSVKQVTQQITGKAQAQVKKTSNNILGAAVSAVQKQVSSTASTINDFLDQKTQQIVSGGTAIPVTVSTITSADIPKDETLVVIDFLAENPHALSFDRHRDYYVTVKNVPPRFCLFIESQEYRVDKSTLLKLSFAEGGSYRLSFNYCRESSPTFGEIVVK